MQPSAIWETGKESKSKQDKFYDGKKICESYKGNNNELQLWKAPEEGTFEHLWALSSKK